MREDAVVPHEARPFETPEVPGLRVAHRVVDEVMKIITETGGMDKIQLAFYPDKAMRDTQPWHFWRLEGPGFVWNYRVLPHVHTYVNISSVLA